jgi:hypothetical protein
MGPSGGQRVAIGAMPTEVVARGHSLVVALVDDGVPYVTRGWALTVVSDAPGQLRLRLVLSSEEQPWFEHRQPSRAIAVTAADPRTLRSVQFKGRAAPAGPLTAEDRADVIRHCDTFFGAVVEADGLDRRLLEGIVPADFIVCTVDVDDVYDQTPGPGAGAVLPGGTR